MRGTRLGTIITIIFVLALAAIPVSEALYRSECVDFGQATVLAVSPEEQLGLPEFVEVGELVRISVPGRKVVWKCLPDNPDYESYGMENENLVISFREPGKYTIIVACEDGDKVALDTYTIEVVSNAINTQPDDPEFVAVLVSDLEGEVVKWCNNAELSRTQAKKLAKNFQKTRKSVIDGDIDTIGKLVKKTYAKVNSNEAAILFGDIQAYTLDQEESGTELSLDDYADLWGTIAGGLLRYAAL